jgi:hypothetical protein
MSSGPDADQTGAGEGGARGGSDPRRLPSRRFVRGAAVALGLLSLVSLAELVAAPESRLWVLRTPILSLFSIGGAAWGWWVLSEQVEDRRRWIEGETRPRTRPCGFGWEQS